MYYQSMKVNVVCSGATEQLFVLFYSTKVNVIFI
jgi:hypothetical protein